MLGRPVQKWLEAWGAEQKDKINKTRYCVMCNGKVTLAYQSTKTNQPCHEWCDTYY